MTALIGKALAPVPPDSHEAGRLLSRYAVNLSAAEGNNEASRELLGRALTIARREGDARLEIRALVDGSRVDALLGGHLLGPGHASPHGTSPVPAGDPQGIAPLTTWQSPSFAFPGHQENSAACPSVLGGPKSQGPPVAVGHVLLSRPGGGRATAVSTVCRLRYGVQRLVTAFSWKHPQEVHLHVLFCSAQGAGPPTGGYVSEGPK